MSEYDFDIINTLRDMNFRILDLFHEMYYV